MLNGELTIQEAKKAIKFDAYQIRLNELQVQEGDVWQLGNHVLYCGDNRSETFLGLCRQHDIAFAFADPPYNAGVDDWDYGFMWEHDYLLDFAPLVAVTPGISSMQQFLRQTAMPYKWMMSAYIDNGMTRGALGFGNWIAIALFYDELPKQVRSTKDFLQVSISTDERDPLEHKGRKPLSLLAHLVGMFAKESEAVCDPFLGSGTTVIACEQKGRMCVGAERDLVYCKSIIARWEQFTRKEAILKERVGTEEAAEVTLWH
jgi:site-specific DNA-methyltransferase (adenine-specific)